MKILDRLKEPSTWAAIATLATQIPLPPYNLMVAGAAGLAAILLREKGSPTEPTAK